MNYNLINKSTHILLLLIFISHLTFAHDLMSDYVLCIGSDGHIAIENVNECDECSDVQFNGDTSSVELNSQDCEDIALNQNCFEVAQFIPKGKIVLTINFEKIATIFEDSCNEKKFNHSYINHDFENPTLESYTTISLLI